MVEKEKKEGGRVLFGGDWLLTNYTLLQYKMIEVYGRSCLLSAFCFSFFFGASKKPQTIIFGVLGKIWAHWQESCIITCIITFRYFYDLPNALQYQQRYYYLHHIQTYRSFSLNLVPNKTTSSKSLTFNLLLSI